MNSTNKYAYDNNDYLDKIRKCICQINIDNNYPKGFFCKIPNFNFNQSEFFK